MSRVINKLRVYEVSLAKAPKNRRKFLLIKEEGMERLSKLVAFLAQRADVPEVVKEELKDFAAGELKEEDILGALEEAGIEIERKEDEEKEPLLKEMESLRKEVEELRKERQEMERQVLRKEVEELVGEEVAKDLVEFYGKLEREEILSLARQFEGLRKAVDELGGRKGSNEDKPAGMSDEQVMEKVEALAKERGISKADALVELAKERPDLIKDWK